MSMNTRPKRKPDYLRLRTARADCRAPDGHLQKKKTNLKAYSTSTSSNESEVCQYHDRHRDGRGRRLCTWVIQHSSSLETRMRSNYVHGVRVIIRVNENYHTAKDYQSYRAIYISQQYDSDVFSRLHRMFKKVAFLMKDQAFNGNDCRVVRERKGEKSHVPSEKKRQNSYSRFWRTTVTYGLKVECYDPSLIWAMIDDS